MLIIAHMLSKTNSKQLLIKGLETNTAVVLDEVNCVVK
jgi:hypothetical protein